MTAAIESSRGLTACAACLRRGLLLGLLAARIADKLGSKRRNPSTVLALEDRRLVSALTTEGEQRSQALRFLEEFDHRAAATALDHAGVTAVCQHGPAYPASLSQLHDPPAVLFCRGQAEEGFTRLREAPAVALVGSRRASPHALEMARELGRGLSAAGITVVSGLALGVDASAHVGSLDGDGFPVAVLGHGPDVVYPQRNSALFQEVAARGLLMSELPPGRRPFRWSFPARNRIMAGLCEATVVVEAAEGSGSLITTEFAEDLGRIVGAVPGPGGWVRARGGNALLRSGAAVITRTEDVLDELAGIGVRPAPAVQVAGTARAEDGVTAACPASDAKAGAVLDALEAGAGIDGACQASGLGAAEVRALLARLEADGHVCRDALGTWTRGPA